MVNIYLEDDVPDVPHDLGAGGEKRDGPRGQVASAILLGVSGVHDAQRWSNSVDWIKLMLGTEVVKM